MVRALGIVDRDQILESNREALKARGIYPLKVYSVESLYFLPDITREIAARQSAVNDADEEATVNAAWDAFFKAVREHGPRLTARMSEGLIKDRISLAMPDWKKISDGSVISINIDVEQVLREQTAKLDALVTDKDAEGILRTYPVRETPALGLVTAALGFKSVASYYAAVRKLVRENSTIKSKLIDLFDGLDRALA